MEWEFALQRPGAEGGGSATAYSPEAELELERLNFANITPTGDDMKRANELFDEAAGKAARTKMRKGALAWWHSE